MSGDNVWNDAIGELLDFVLQRQLALLHPRQLELVAIARCAKQLDFLVEAAMLRLEKLQNLPRIIIIHAPVLQEARPAVTHWRSTANRSAGEPFREKW